MSSPRYRRRKYLRRRLTVLGVVVAALGLGTLLATRGGGLVPPRTSVPQSTERTTATVPATTLTPIPPFAVGTASFTLTERAGPGGAARALPTAVRYPATGAAGVPDQQGAAPLRDGGPYPLVVFSDGFDIDPAAYAPLLDAWAAAGYVVAEPVYPFTAPGSPGGVMREDIVHHPADLSFVITSLLQDSAAPGNSLTGLIDTHEVGVIGHSDGGDVSLAAAANSCCHDSRIKAAAILSGAELTWFGGTYFSTPPVPLLVVQGTSDTVGYNSPSCSVQLFDGAPQPKYYLSMIGQTHTSAYIPAGQPRDVVAKVTIDFLNGYLKRSKAATAAIAAAGTVPGLATLTTAPTVPPNSEPCPGAPAG